MILRSAAGLLRHLLAVLLMLEGAVSLLTASALIPALAAYDAGTLVLLAARGLVSLLQVTAGWLLAANRPPGAQLGGASLVASALLATLELGFRLAPSDVDPAWRWPYVVGYWTYALLGTAWLRTQRA